MNDHHHHHHHARVGNGPVGMILKLVSGYYVVIVLCWVLYFFVVAPFKLAWDGICALWGATTDDQHEDAFLDHQVMRPGPTVGRDWVDFYGNEPPPERSWANTELIKEGRRYDVKMMREPKPPGWRR